MSLESEFNLSIEQIEATYRDITDRLTERAIVRERVTASVFDELVKEIDDLVAGIIILIATIDVQAPSRAAFKRRRLVTLQKEIRTLTRSSYRTLKRVSERRFVNFLSIEAGFFANALNESLTANAANTNNPFKPLRQEAIDTLADRQTVLGATINQWWGAQSDGTVDRISRAIQQGFDRGEGTEQLIRRIRGTRAGRFQDGVIQRSRRGALTIVRTALNAIANAANEQIIEENKALLAGYQHISVIDGNTSDVCIARSNLRWDLDQRPIDHDFPYDTPPLHPNCRSIVQPLLNASVPPVSTFDSFFKRQSAKKQGEIIGVGKAKLYREGRITLRDLVNQQNRPLTLEQLQEMNS